MDEYDRFAAEWVMLNLGQGKSGIAAKLAREIRDRFGGLRESIQALRQRIQSLEERLDQPDWRERR